MLESGVSVCALSSTIANWSHSILEPFVDTLPIVERTIHVMKELEIPYVRIMSYAVEFNEKGMIAENQFVHERIRRLREICDRFLQTGLIPLHENCSNYGGLSFRKTLELVEAIEGLQLLFDTGNPPVMIDGSSEYPYSRQDSWEFYQAVKDHIAYVHLKDAYYDPVAKKSVFTLPGMGEAQVSRILSDLKASAFAGMISIEPHITAVYHKSSSNLSTTAMKDSFHEYANQAETILETLC